MEGVVYLRQIFKCGKLCFSSVYSLHHEFPAAQTDTVVPLPIIRLTVRVW